MTQSKPHVVPRLKLTEPFDLSQEAGRSVRQPVLVLRRWGLIASESASAGAGPPTRRFIHPILCGAL